jgi:hypothetical protein
LSHFYLINISTSISESSLQSIKPSVLNFSS